MVRQTRARSVAIVAGFCRAFGFYTSGPLWAQTSPPTTQQQPSPEAPQILEPLVVTGRADDLAGSAGSAADLPDDTLGFV